MCKLCAFIEDDILGRLETNLDIIQCLPLTGWRQKRVSRDIFKLLERYQAIKDDAIKKLEHDYDEAWSRFQANPNVRTETFFEEMRKAKYAWMQSFNRVAKLLDTAQPWLTVMEA